MQMFMRNKSLHKWLSLFVGIQLLLWLGTGLYFNLMDHQKASGDEFREQVVHANDFTNGSLIELGELSEITGQKIQLLWILGKPIYQITKQASAHSYQVKDIQLVDATSGKEYQLDQSLVKRIAMASYAGDTHVNNIALLSPPIEELPREENSLWQVRLNDTNNTNVYIDPSSGRVMAHVNNDRRLRDLMFKLHFMDYWNSGGFNHWLIILFAFSTLFLSITGATWLIQLYKSGMLTINWGSRKQKVAVLFVNEATESTITLDKNLSLLEGLAQTQVYLPSACGGGGTCGKCIFKTENDVVITPSDKELIPLNLQEQGYRLGCQHKVSEVKNIELRKKFKSRKSTSGQCSV